jgi:Na+/H+-translocating membrane pyrophosphatase
MGAAPNIILGLALGYMSTVIPILAIALTIFVSFSFGGVYGLALAALGMLSCLPLAVTIQGFAPISRNANAIADMAGLNERAIESIDTLESAGISTAAKSKAFGNSSACLASLALFGAFTTRIGLS